MVATSCFAGVSISAPANGSTVGSPVHFVASASGATTIASMIIYVDGNQNYLVYANSLDTAISLGAGSHFAVIKAWDNYGNVYSASETFTVGSGAGSTSGTWVNVSSPSNGAMVGSPVTINANGGSPNGISGWVIYSDDQNVFLANNYSDALSASVNLPGGSHTLYVRAWDRANGQFGTSSKFTVNVNGSAGGGGTVTAGTPIYDIQTMGDWGNCTVCAGWGGNGPSADYSMWQWQSDPSLDGKSTRFIIWGGAPYSDVLWWKSLSSIIGNTSAQHHFIYDTYFMVDNADNVQSLEFDVNQFVNGHSLIFGTQCNVRDGNNWDVWDNQNSRWVHTGVYCGAPSAWVWHHVTIEVERAADGGDWLHYVSITLDGNKHYIDRWYPPAWTGWNGITVNFQMDSDYAGHGYSTWLDKLTFSYW